jgi:integrase
VDKAGAKRWAFVYVRQGKRREMGLGSAAPNEVKLADARTRASAARDILREGGDPLAERSVPASAPTFATVAAKLILSLRPGWRSRITARQWVMSLRVYAKPLRAKPVDQITTEDVLGCLAPIWNTKPETARRVRARIEAVLDAAKAQKHRTGENPAAWRGHLALLLPKSKPLSRGHHPALPYEDAPAFMARLRAADGMGARALEFCVLTLAREGEITGVPWDEIDLERAVWTIPPERTKTNREHRVPLSGAAMALLGRVTMGGDTGLVFPGAEPGRPLSNATMDAVLKRMKLAATPHGFRSTFRDWAGDCTNAARETAEECLAHRVGSSVERAYRRRDAMQKRKDLLQLWADYLGGAAVAQAVDEGA